MDISAAMGTPIYACADGTVKLSKAFTEGGNAVILKHADGSYSYYGHMRELGLVSIGDTVSRGQLIGHVGGQGHIHFEWTDHDPYCEFVKMGYDLRISPGSGAAVYPHVHPDTQAPQASSTAYVTNVSENGFDISLFGKDDQSIRKAPFLLFLNSNSSHGAKKTPFLQKAASFL